MKSYRCVNIRSGTSKLVKQKVPRQCSKMAQKNGSSLARKITEYLTGKEMRDYLMSTHFWAPATTWGVPLAAIADTQKHPKLISGKMTLALVIYSSVAMRFALRVKPKNMLLFACHFTNASAQTVQGIRFIKYHHLDDDLDYILLD
uniref:Mitochondrial pyruvate carrier n=1 Tax=Glossina brevipalpis TaxID=37001 RepID=A0A1A9W7Z7_9MUSC